MSYFEKLLRDEPWPHAWARGVGMPIGSAPSIFKGKFSDDLHAGVWYPIYHNLESKVQGHDLLS
jgi:hypothetical protein